MTKYEMAERVAVAIQQSDKAIAGIDASVLTVAFMSLRLTEVQNLYKANVDVNAFRKDHPIHHSHCSCNS